MIETHDFCHGWRFAKGDVEGAARPAFDDAGWSAVTVPHTWNADDMYPGEPREAAYIGPAWYRKRFRLRPLDADERAMLRFEAIANHSEVWVDGKFVGGKDDGFLELRLDVTDALEPGEEHVVAVRSDNAHRSGYLPPEWLDWERYGGMYRPAWLEVRGGAHFAHRSTQIATPEVSTRRAMVTIRSVVRERAARSRLLTMRHRLIGPDGEEQGAVEFEIASALGAAVSHDALLPDVERPRLWSPADPALYRIESELRDGERVLDREVHPLGLRWFTFGSEGGFALNGEPMKLCGVDVHQDYPGLGNACPARFHRRDAELIKAAGMNFVRTSHYPRNERFLDACDALGVMVMSEQPFWHGSLRVRHGEKLLDHGRRYMREMVAQHGNHPSIICWNTVNEVMLTPVIGEPHPDPEQRRKQHQLQPEEWPFARRGVGVLSDALHEADWQGRPTCVVIGGRWKDNAAAGLTEMADLIGYNGGAMGGDLQAEPPYDVLREADPTRRHVMTEGILNFDEPHRADWDHEHRWWKTAAAHWSRLYQRPWFCGGAMWVFADYSANGTMRWHGCVDYARVPYESYWFFQSQWSDRLMVHINCHWSWDDEPGAEREVAVFTNGEAVELWLNGRSLGPGRSTAEEYPGLPHPPVVWQAPWEPGELKAIARRGGEQLEDIRRTEGEPTAIRLNREQAEIRADGRDVAFLTAVVVDADGERCYRDFRELELEVRGAARLAGPAKREARGGVAGFAVRAHGAAGEINVIARGAGLAEGSASLRAVDA